MQAFTARFATSMQLYSPRRKTAHRALQALFLRFVPLSRPRYQTDTSGYNTDCETLERITAHGLHAAYTRYCRNARTLHRSEQPQTMPARRGQLLTSADRWQVLARFQQYRPGAPAEGVSVSICTGSARRRLDTSHARRLVIWYRVSLAPSTRRGSPAAKARRAARNYWRLPPHLFFGLSPDSQ